MAEEKQRTRKKPKEQESIEPDLQFAVLCDNVAQGPGGKPVFVGVFENIGKTGHVPQFFVVTRWTNGLGEHTVKLRILDPDLEPVLITPEMPIKLNEKSTKFTTRTGFQNFPFLTGGVYWIEVLLNERPVLAVSIPVFEG